jgi:hypothetical protein
LRFRRAPALFFAMTVRAARHNACAALSDIAPGEAGGDGSAPSVPRKAACGCRGRRVSLPGRVERGRSASFVQLTAASGWRESGERLLPSRGAGECGTTPCPGWKPVESLRGPSAFQAPRSGAGSGAAAPASGRMQKAGLRGGCILLSE